MNLSSLNLLLAVRRLALVSLLAVLAASSAGSQPVPVTVTAEPLGVGRLGDAVVAVDGAGGRGVLAFSFTAEADPSVVAFVGAEVAGTLAAGWSVAVNASTPGVLRVSAAGTTPLAGDGPLVVLKLSGVAVGSTAVTWSAFSFNEGDPVADADDGSVEVVASTAGEGAPEAPRLRVWPNPSAGPLWVEVPCAAGPLALTVVDVLGRVVRAERDVCGSIPLDGLASGHYVVRAGAASRPVVIVR